MKAKLTAQQLNTVCDTITELPMISNVVLSHSFVLMTQDTYSITDKL